jgi:CRP/FNR family transcriptional regulator
MHGGSTLFNQGDKFTAVHMVVSGSIKLLEISKEGRERVVALYLPGELVGMEGWNHGYYPYTAMATGIARLCQLQWPRTHHTAASSALLERLLRKTVAHSTPQNI